MTDAYDRLKSALADRYALERELGAGGMATVYLAEDLKHHRKVAVKVLRPELAAVLGGERFVQEITTTANLQHPHILPLFDSGEADGFLYYVMPFIDGETLRDKLNRETQLGIEEAVKITTEVADALDYAHRHNVIHRDIKPENILLHDGRPTVADFGIALAVSAAAGGRMTETGLSLGTPHYMSPEQATAEKDITNRSDIYSLGAVLYELLTGEPPHMGNSAQQIIMKIVTDEARPVTELRKSVPSNVAASTAKALEKLPADRFATAAEYADALTNPAFTTVLPGTGHPAAAQATTWNRMTVVFAAFCAVLLGVVGLLIWTNDSSSSADASWMSLSLHNSADFAATDLPVLAFAPGGRRFVYRGSDQQLWLRDLGQLEATPLRGTANARLPAFSPDGESLAFLNESQGSLTVVSLGGGPARMVTDSGLADITLSGGGVDWAGDGSLYVAGLEGLVRIDPQDGSREVVTILDQARDDRAHVFLDVLPNEKGALVTIVPRNIQDKSAYRIAVVDFRTGTVEVVLQGVYARYATSGHVVFVQDDGSLLAAPFNQNRLAVTGTAVPLAGRVLTSNFLVPHLAVSDEGMLLYASGAQGERVVVWVDRDGNEEIVDPNWAGAFREPVLSPDGSRLALSNTTNEGQHIWIKSLDGEPASRLTFDGISTYRATWTPDGQAVFFASDRSGISALYQKRADGSAAATRVPIADSRPISGVDLSRDGQWLIVRTDNQAPGRGDILALPLGGDSVPRALVATAAEELSPSLSPDGRWLAYVSDESGQREVYVRPFPDTENSMWQVSTEGGTEPLWAHSGRELFYRDANENLVAARVVTEPTFSPGAQRILFSAAEYVLDFWQRGYDVSGDDQRFLMLKQLSGENTELIMVLNFFEELKQRVGNGND
ncbi:LpqB family beta-propeller domain-containing protein [Gemmatimonadota bacterium]